MTYLLAHDSHISEAKKLHHRGSTHAHCSLLTHKTHKIDKEKQKHVAHEVGAIGDNGTMNVVLGVEKKKGSPSMKYW